MMLTQKEEGTKVSNDASTPYRKEKKNNNKRKVMGGACHYVNEKENKNKKNKKIIKTEIKKDKIKDNNESNYNSENDISLLDKDLFQIRNENKWYKKEYLTEKYNDLIITTENLEKNLNMKYLQGTENIIAEIEEPKYIRDDSDINTNTINQNLSLRKHLSIRETTLDTSYRNNSEYNHTENTKGRKKGYFIRIKNYRQLFIRNAIK